MWPCKDRGRAESYLAISQRIYEATRSWKRQGSLDSPLERSEGVWTPDFGLLASRLGSE